MSYRIYNNDNTLVLIDTNTWRVEKLARNKCWYKYIATDAPILYSLYYGHPERDLVLDAPYTYFEKEDGSSFLNDGELQNYLDKSLVLSTADYHTKVALGLVEGAETWNKFGYNNDVDSGSGDEIIAAWGGTYQFLTVGETISIVSTSAADADGDTGVNSIVVYGVDENWDSQIVVYLMNGTTPVVSTENWIGINRVAVFLSGTSRVNVGEINITASSSGYTLAQMPTGGGVTQQMIFFVPVNYKFLAEWLHFDALKISGGGGNPEITLKGFVYSAVNNTIQEVFRGHLDTTNSNNLAVEPPVPFPISEKSILYFTANTDKDNTSVTSRFSGELIRDTDA